MAFMMLRKKYDCAFVVLHCEDDVLIASIVSVKSIKTFVAFFMFYTKASPIMMIGCRISGDTKRRKNSRMNDYKIPDEVTPWTFYYWKMFSKSRRKKQRLNYKFA